MSNSVQTPEPVNNSVQTPETMGNSVQTAETILRKQEVAEFLRWSKRQIEKKVKEGKFPKPFYISGGSPRWLLSDLTAWLDQTRAQSTSMCADKE